MNTNDWFLKLQASAKEIEARIFLIPELVIDYTKSFKELLVNSNIPILVSSYALEAVEKYPLLENEVIKKDIILFNWPMGIRSNQGGYQKSLEWGLSNGLFKTTPHILLAIGREKPNLAQELKTMQFVSVVETTGSILGNRPIACEFLWNFGHHQFAYDYSISFGYDSTNWFAFAK